MEWYSSFFFCYKNCISGPAAQKKKKKAHTTLKKEKRGDVFWRRMNARNRNMRKW